MIYDLKIQNLIGQEYSRSYLARNISLGLRLAANIKRWD